MCTWLLLFRLLVLPLFSYCVDVDLAQLSTFQYRSRLLDDGHVYHFTLQRPCAAACSARFLVCNDYSCRPLHLGLPRRKGPLAYLDLAWMYALFSIETQPLAVQTLFFQRLQPFRSLIGRANQINRGRQPRSTRMRRDGTPRVQELGQARRPRDTHVLCKVLCGEDESREVRTRLAYLGEVLYALCALDQCYDGDWRLCTLCLYAACGVSLGQHVPYNIGNEVKVCGGFAFGQHDGVEMLAFQYGREVLERESRVHAVYAHTCFLYGARARFGEDREEVGAGFGFHVRRDGVFEVVGYRVDVHGGGFVQHLLGRAWDWTTVSWKLVKVVGGRVPYMTARRIILPEVAMLRWPIQRLVVCLES